MARRSLYCILAPTSVSGLPIHFDQVSIDPDQVSVFELQCLLFMQVEHYVEF